MVHCPCHLIILFILISHWISLNQIDSAIPIIFSPSQNHKHRSHSCLCRQQWSDKFKWKQNHSKQSYWENSSNLLCIYWSVPTKKILNKIAAYIKLKANSITTISKISSQNRNFSISMDEKHKLACITFNYIFRKCMKAVHIILHRPSFLTLAAQKWSQQFNINLEHLQGKSIHQLQFYFKRICRFSKS